jgi:hypothetical protein
MRRRCKTCAAALVAAGSWLRCAAAVPPVFRPKTEVLGGALVKPVGNGPRTCIPRGQVSAGGTALPPPVTRNGRERALSCTLRVGSDWHRACCMSPMPTFSLLMQTPRAMKRKFLTMAPDEFNAFLQHEVLQMGKFVTDLGIPKQ